MTNKISVKFGFLNSGNFGYYSDYKLPKIFDSKSAIDDFIKDSNYNKAISLLCALEDNNVEIFDYILPKVNLKYIDDNDVSLGFTAACRALKNKNALEYIEKLKQYGFDINEKSSDQKETLLISYRNKFDECELLYKAGASANEVNRHGRTALAEIREDDPSITELHIKNGADINVEGDYGNTLLEHFLTLGYCKVPQVLLKNGANPNALTSGRDSMALAALHGVNNHRYHNVSEEDKVHLISSLIKNGLDINIKNKKGENIVANSARGMGNISGILLGAELEVPKKQYEKHSESFALMLKELGGLNAYFKLKEANLGYNTFKSLVEQNQIKQILPEKKLSL